MKEWETLRNFPGISFFAVLITNHILILSEEGSYFFFIQPVGCLLSSNPSVRAVMLMQRDGPGHDKLMYSVSAVQILQRIVCRG